MTIGRRIATALLVVAGVLALATCDLLVVPTPFGAPADSVSDDGPSSSGNPETTGASVTVAPTNVGVTEGGANATYTVVLDVQPAADVVITPTGGTEVTMAPASLTFSPTNWNTAQTVTVTAVDDGDAEGNHSDTVSHVVSSDDGAYDGLAVDTVAVSVVDNDAPGVSVAPVTVAVTEGGAPDSYDLVLTTAPTANVTIVITATGGEVAVAPNPITFTALNWDVPQTLNVSAIDDGAVEGPHLDTITHAATSTDTGYDGLAIFDVTANITDNDFLTVTYDANVADFGVPPTDATNYAPTDLVNVLTNSGGLVRNGFVFSGWNTAADGSGTSYAFDGSANFAIGGADVTLYAEWDNSFGGFAGGTGTTIDPYIVATHEHLSNIRTNLKAEYIQTDDINLDVAPWNTGAGWAPIAGDFAGVYDGNGFVINNLFINRPTTNRVALFEYLVKEVVGDIDPRILNVALLNVDVTGDVIVGSIVASGDSVPASDGRIIESYVTGVVTGTDQVGGIIGRTRQVAIERSFADVVVTAAGNYAGGLVGWAGASGPIIDSYALGDVSGADGVGGLVGYGNGSAISNSYSIGVVSGLTNVGGLVGLKTAGGGANNFYDENTSGVVGDTVAGWSTAESTVNMQQIATFGTAGWDIDVAPGASIWGIVNGASYPYLDWQPVGTGTRP